MQEGGDVGIPRCMPSSGAPDSPLTISCFVSSSRSSHRWDLNIPRDYFLSEIEDYVGSV